MFILQLSSSSFLNLRFFLLCDFIKYSIFFFKRNLSFILVKICLFAGRLAGVVLLAPVVNYWWTGLPANLSTEAYYEQYVEDQWALRVSHYAPWLTYWWNTQKLFPSSSVASGRPRFSRQDYEILGKLASSGKQKDKVLYHLILQFHFFCKN